jgi:hypothetical protein
MSQDAPTPAEWRRVVGILAAITFGLLVLWSHRHGVGGDPPAVALGWAPLLHLERAAAVFGVLGGVALIGWKALHREFPVKFGNLIEYEVAHRTIRTTERAVRATDALEARLLVLEGLMGIEEDADTSRN